MSSDIGKAESSRAKKVLSIALIALLLALLAFVTADTNNVFEIVVNNTNLAPSFTGGPTGTGERVSGATYFTNTSPIEVFLFAHANNNTQTTDIQLEINGIVVSRTSTRPLGVAEQTNQSIISIIPKNSSYRADFSNFHHYEWREYPILSGKNGTLSVNQTIVGGGGTGNASYPIDAGNKSQLINLTGWVLLNVSTVTTDTSNYNITNPNPAIRHFKMTMDINNTDTSFTEFYAIYLNGDMNQANYTSRDLLNVGCGFASVTSMNAAGAVALVQFSGDAPIYSMGEYEAELDLANNGFYIFKSIGVSTGSGLCNIQRTIGGASSRTFNNITQFNIVSSFHSPMTPLTTGIGVNTSFKLFGLVE